MPKCCTSTAFFPVLRHSVDLPAAAASQDSVDDGEKDGQIQLREFLMLYTNGLDSKNAGRKEDVEDVFRAVVANENNLEETRENARAPVKEAIAKSALQSMLSSAFDLDVDCDELFTQSAKSGEVSREEMTNFPVTKPKAAAS